MAELYSPFKKGDRVVWCSDGDKDQPVELLEDPYLVSNGTVTDMAATCIDETGHKEVCYWFHYVTKGQTGHWEYADGLVSDSGIDGDW